MSNQRSRIQSPVYLCEGKDSDVCGCKSKTGNEDFNCELNAPKTSSFRSHKMKRPRKPGSQVPTRKLMVSPSERVRSVSPPWVPPPGKTTKASKSRINVFWDEEEAKLSQHDQYEQQINGLLNEVGDLREQLKIEKQREQIRDSFDIIKSQEEQIDELKQEMESMEKDNYLLHDALNKSRNGVCFPKECNKLIKLLIETEKAGERSVHQMQHVFDYLKTFFKKGHIINNLDIDRIRNYFHDTESRFFEFQSLNIKLREILKDFLDKKNRTDRSLEKDNSFVFKKSKELEENISAFEQDLCDKDRIISDLRKQLTIKNDETLNFADTHESLEHEKGHLQQLLKQKTGDCNRMSVQLHTLEHELAKEKQDKEHIIEKLSNQKGCSYDDREILKKAVKTHKQRALKAEETIQELTILLAEKERYIDILQQPKRPRSHSAYQSNHCYHCPKSKRCHSLEDLSARTHWPSSSDKENQEDCERCLEDNNQAKQCTINGDHESMLLTLKMENETLRSVAKRCESRLKDVEKEMETLRQTMTESNEEQNDDNLSKLLEKIESSERSNKSNLLKIEELERTIKNLENQNTEIKYVVQHKENCVIDSRCKIDDLIRENSSLRHQLEGALTDSRRNVDMFREKNNDKERQLQFKVKDIESELAQQKSESNKWRRTSEETERRLNSKVQDMKIQLEQAEITNRSIQTYVQFLKKSYANVLGDIPLPNGFNATTTSFLGPSLSFSGL